MAALGATLHEHAFENPLLAGAHRYPQYVNHSQEDLLNKAHATPRLASMTLDDMQRMSIASPEPKGEGPAENKQHLKSVVEQEKEHLELEEDEEYGGDEQTDGEMFCENPRAKPALYDTVTDIHVSPPTK